MRFDCDCRTAAFGTVSPLQQRRQLYGGTSDMPSASMGCPPVTRTWSFLLRVYSRMIDKDIADDLMCGIGFGWARMAMLY